ncbi:MAG: UvrB/UvrC motif-containing protein [Oscillospiraceae bacterium]|nr:UvrB/UvrC motif-containing protein [Oscillospiraceae bacterium]
MFFEFEPEIFNVFILKPSQGHPNSIPAAEKKICKMCGVSFADITKTGKAGCGECYETFKNELTHSIIRIHGAVNHTGKIPKNRRVKISAKRKLEELSFRMQKAVGEQNFEEAANIRDEINKIKTEAGEV